MKNSKTFYITTAIDYANSKPHLGTAFEKIGADVLARYFRRHKGCNVHFLMGNDEHSQNVRKRADEKGMDPKAYCDEMANVFKDVWSDLHLAYDDFIQTSQPRHHAMVQELASRIFEARDEEGQSYIYKKAYEGHYCVSCEAYYSEKDLTKGHCPTHQTPTELRSEENYFFRLSAFQSALEAHYAANPSFLRPDTRRNEILGLLKKGLEDISISRRDSDWGVPLPFDDQEVAYVWFDALINYLSALGPLDGEMHQKYWPASLHVIGKDITRFHCLVWPAMLMAAGLPLPKGVWAHGFVNIDGEKMSKTRGNVADPKMLAETYGADRLRFFLMREVPWDQDGDFSIQRLIERCNADLSNDFGNLLSRVVSMSVKYFGETLDNTKPTDPFEAFLSEVDQNMEAFHASMQDGLPHKALEHVWMVVRASNGLIDREQPWSMAKDASKKDRLESLMRTLLCAIYEVQRCLTPFMPEKMREARAVLEKETQAWSWEDTLPQTFTLTKGKPLFPRLEAEDA